MEAYDDALLAELQKKAEEVFPGAPITVTWFLEQCDSSMEERRIFQSKERPILVPEWFQFIMGGFWAALVASGGSGGRRMHV